MQERRLTQFTKCFLGVNLMTKQNSTKFSKPSEIIVSHVKTFFMFYNHFCHSKIKFSELYFIITKQKAKLCKWCDNAYMAECISWKYNHAWKVMNIFRSQEIWIDKMCVWFTFENGISLSHQIHNISYNYHCYVTYYDLLAMLFRM